MYGRACCFQNNKLIILDGREDGAVKHVVLDDEFEILASHDVELFFFHMHLLLRV